MKKALVKLHIYLDASRLKPRKTLWNDFSSNLYYSYRINKYYLKHYKGSLAICFIC